MNKKLCVFYLLVLIFALTGCMSKPNINEAPVSKLSTPSTITTSPIIETAPQPKPIKWIPPEGTFPLPDNGVPVLYYHSIANQPTREELNLGTVVSTLKFREQMQYLKDAGYSVVSLDQLTAALQGAHNLPDRPVAITLDDGYLNNYTNAYPILKQLNFTATIFIPVGHLIPGPNNMQWSQVQELFDYGITIAPHGVNHLNLADPKLTLQDQVYEISASKQYFEEKLGTKMNYFCYPYGGYTNTALKALKDNGYVLAFTTEFGRAQKKDSPYLLKRIFVHGDKDLNEFKRRLSQ